MSIKYLIIDLYASTVSGGGDEELRFRRAKYIEGTIDEPKEEIEQRQGDEPQGLAEAEEQREQP